MGQIDEKKEYIGLLKSYLSIIVAFILASGAGISKLYLSNDINILFWIGVGFIISFVIMFMLVANKAHKEVKLLKNIKE